MGLAQCLQDAPGQVLRAEDPGAQGVIDIMVDVRHPVRPGHARAFQRLGRDGTAVVGDAVANLFCQVEAGAVFQLLHHAQALLIVPEAAVTEVVQRALADMPEGGMPQVVPQGDGFRQVLVEAQRPRDGAGHLLYLQGVGQAGAEMVALRCDEDLGLELQPPEALGVQDAVAVPLVIRAQVVRADGAVASGAFRASGREFGKALLLPQFGFLAYCHGRILL